MIKLFRGLPADQRESGKPRFLLKGDVGPTASRCFQKPYCVRQY